MKLTVYVSRFEVCWGVPVPSCARHQGGGSVTSLNSEELRSVDDAFVVFR